MKRVALLLVLVFVFLLSLGDFWRTSEEINAILRNPLFFSNLKGVPLHVVAPSSKIEDTNLQKILSYLAPLDISVPADIQGGDLPYHANDDAKRAELLISAFSRPERGVVWALRGGYGAARLLKYLNNIPKPQEMKLFVGYSDATAIHLFLAQKWDWPSIHGPMVSELLMSQKDPNNFLRLSEIVSLKKRHLSYDGLTPINAAAKQLLEVSGKVTGGNLTIVLSSLGTPWQIQGQGKIIILEDVFSLGGRVAYRIDRALHQLVQADVFEDAAAIILGSIGNDTHVEFAVQRFGDEISTPLFKAEWFGHEATNYPIILNWDSVIQCAEGSEGDRRCKLSTDITSLPELGQNRNFENTP